MPLQDCLELIISLLNLSVQCYPEQMEYIDKLLSFSTEIIDKYKAQQLIFFYFFISSFYIFLFLFLFLNMKILLTNI